MPRLTITLEDDLYAMARAHAIASGLSISKAIDDLLRRRPAVPGSIPPPSRQPAGEPPDDHPAVHPLSGLPVSRSDGRRITSEDVRRAEEEEDLRILEAGGFLSPRSEPR